MFLFYFISTTVVLSSEEKKVYQLPDVFHLDGIVRVCLTNFAFYLYVPRYTCHERALYFNSTLFFRALLCEESVTFTHPTVLHNTTLQVCESIKQTTRRVRERQITLFLICIMREESTFIFQCFSFTLSQLANPPPQPTHHCMLGCVWKFRFFWAFNKPQTTLYVLCAPCATKLTPVLLCKRQTHEHLICARYPSPLFPSFPRG